MQKMKTLGDLLNDYCDWKATLNFQAITIKDARCMLEPFIRWLAAKHRIRRADQLQRRHLQNWQVHLASRTNYKNKPDSPATINNKISAARGFLTFLGRRGYVDPRLHEGLELARLPQKLPGTTLTHKEVRKTLDTIPTDTVWGYRNRTMLELMYSSGLRASELLGIDLGDLDMENHTVTVTGKGRKQRVVPIGKTAMRFLETYLVALRSHLVLDPMEKALFLNRRGKRMRYKSLRLLVDELVDAAVPEQHITSHVFRRSCTTELIRGGANMYHVKELLGHESLDTLRYYTKLTILDLKETHARCHPAEREGRS